MKSRVFFLSLLAISFAKDAPNSPVIKNQEDGTKMGYFYYEGNDGSLIVENLRDFKRGSAQSARKAEDGDVEFYFTSTDNPDASVKVTAEDVDFGFNSNSDWLTYVIVHDWKNDKDSEMSVEIHKALLSNSLNYEVNVFVVDWSSIANESYVVAQSSVNSIGEQVGSFIQSLVENQGLSLKKTFMTGHGLGAHICGNAGAFLEGEVNYIVALDPSLPLFSINNTENRVDETDANYVQIIHTSSLGFQDALGHYDYYPNGGITQPGCGYDPLSSCSHRRSYLYYSESITASGFNFIGSQCNSWCVYEDGGCGSHVTSEMGGVVPEKRSIRLGTYHLRTNSEPPYSESM